MQPQTKCLVWPQHQQWACKAMKPTGNSLWPRIRGRLERIKHQARLRISLRHLHGPRGRHASLDEVTVVTLVRDGAYYLPAFFDHYRNLGIRHFVFIDNGSCDDTLEMIRAQPGTVILQSLLPWGAFENDFRRYAAERYCRDRWCLFADMDEVFDFEGRAEIGLSGLIRYLHQHGVTALMAQMLEMFPKAPLSEVADLPYDQVLKQFHHCDISAVRAVDYASPQTGFSYYLQQNTLDNPDTQILFGGIRGKVFGENCCLSKHPLVFVADGVAPGLHPHCASQVRVAGFAALIKHYKFANDAAGRDRASIATASINHGEDRLRASRMENTPDLSLWSDTAQDFPGIHALQQQGFLMKSAAYSAFVAQQTP